MRIKENKNIFQNFELSFVSFEKFKWNFFLNITIKY